MGSVVGLVFWTALGILVGWIVYFCLFHLAKYYTGYPIICNFFRCFYDIRPFVLAVLFLPLLIFGRDFAAHWREVKNTRQLAGRPLVAWDWLTNRAFYVGMVASLPVNPHIIDFFSNRPY